jgi:uncharacterized protein YcbX
MLLELVAFSWSAALSVIPWRLVLTKLFSSYGILIVTVWVLDNFITDNPLKQSRRHSISRSNLTDQHNQKYGPLQNRSHADSMSVKALFIHPIKSCKAVELNRALLTKSGFLYDRCFAFAAEVDDVDADEERQMRFISQRTKPQMSQIGIELWLPKPIPSHSDPLLAAGGSLVVTFPDPSADSGSFLLETIFRPWKWIKRTHIKFIIPLIPTATQIKVYGIRLRHFTIHHRNAQGLDMGKIPAVAAVIPQLKRFLKIPERRELTLFRCTQDTLSRTDRNLAPLKYIGLPAVHGYTDQQPIHINSLSSVQALSLLLPAENQPLNALRFRANIWIAGAPAFEEETWKRYRILPKKDARDRANVAPKMSVVCRTSRCTMPNVDPNKGTFDEDTPSA